MDLWLSSLFDCIQFCVFLFFKKLFLSSLTTSRQISTDSYLSIPLDFFFLIDLNTSSIHQSFMKFVSIVSRQILDQSRIFLSSWQILDPSRLASVDSYSTTSRSIEILLHTLFSHVLHLSFIFSSIASCFITFMHLYGFLVPPWSSLCFSGEAF